MSTWALTETGTVFHDFNGDTAVCRRNLKAGRAQRFRTRKEAQRTVDMTRVGFRMCVNCVKKDDAYNARVEASMAPVNPYDQVCEGLLSEETATVTVSAEDAVRTATEAGVTVGAVFSPAPNAAFRHDPMRRVTVTKVEYSERLEDVFVSYNIWEPGYQGSPENWGSSCSLSVFMAVYEPAPKPTTYRVTVGYRLPGVEEEMFWVTRVTPAASSAKALHAVVKEGEAQFRSSGPKGSDILEIRARRELSA